MEHTREAVITKHGSLEQGLEELLKNQARKGEPILLHGTVHDIEGDSIKPMSRPYVFATNYPAIALLKALINNRKARGSNIKYPLTRNDDMIITFFGLDNKAIQKKGNIYILPQAPFRKEGRAEYLSLAPVAYIGRIDVKREDLRYPIFDGETRQRIG